MKTHHHHRQGSAWNSADDLRLITEIVAGHDAEEIAERLGRTPGAIRARSRRLTPRAADVDRHSAVAWLRARLLVDPRYDWRVAHREWIRHPSKQPTADSWPAPPPIRDWTGTAHQQQLPLSALE